jgi:hypothetical protein
MLRRVIHKMKYMKSRAKNTCRELALQEENIKTKNTWRFF